MTHHGIAEHIAALEARQAARRAWADWYLDMLTALIDREDRRIANLKAVAAAQAAAELKAVPTRKRSRR